VDAFVLYNVTVLVDEDVEDGTVLVNLANATSDTTDDVPGNDEDTKDTKVAGSGFALNVTKFYDANANGQFDGGEISLDGWKFSVDNTVYLTPIEIVMNSLQFTVTEHDPIENNWQNTTSKIVDIDLDSAEDVDLEFGNVCVEGDGGGKTQGFWSNRNGQILYNAAGDSNEMLSELNLVEENGDDFDPDNYASFRNWLKDINKNDNMAYKLSVQLSAMALNAYAGDVNGGTYLYAPELAPFATEIESITGEEFTGFITVNDLILVADSILADDIDGIIDEKDSNFAFAEAVKDVLDSGNNNESIFVSSTPCEFSFE